MFTVEIAHSFASRMVEDWNKNDLECILKYFTNDIVFTSSNIQRFIPDSNGSLIGKETLKNYWIFIKEKFPYFNYQLHHVDYEANKLILQFYNPLTQTYSNGILFLNEEWMIYRMVVSYV